MPVRMLRTERIAIDGRSVQWYREGDIINVPEPLGAALIRDGIATDKLTTEPQEESMPSAHQPKVQYKPKKR